MDSSHSEDATRTNLDEDEARRFRRINSNGDEHSEDGEHDDYTTMATTIPRWRRRMVKGCINFAMDFNRNSAERVIPNWVPFGMRHAHVTWQVGNRGYGEVGWPWPAVVVCVGG